MAAKRIVIMGIFVAGNLLCALAPNYELLMCARILTALCHGAFFGIASIVAAELALVDVREELVFSQRHLLLARSTGDQAMIEFPPGREVGISIDAEGCAAFPLT